MKKPVLNPDFLSTAQVAEALGIGVSTVKRWVEDGILPASKTAGGHRKLLLADVLEVARQNNLPVRDLARLAPGASAKRHRVEPASLAESLYKALISGDGQQVRGMIHGTHRNGMTIESLADLVIAPAMHRIGSDWEASKIDVMHEHRATQLCAGALFELKESLGMRVKPQWPTAVGAATEGDLSLLPTLLSQMTLLDAGWDAVNLGPNTPLQSLALAATELAPRLVWLSVSHPVDEQSFRRAYGRLYQHLEKLGVPIIVGGQWLNERLRAAIPYTAFGDGLTHLAAFARTLHPRPRLPKRGRPRGA
jgi:excisionase family DNA binding protein